MRWILWESILIFLFWMKRLMLMLLLLSSSIVVTSIVKSFSCFEFWTPSNKRHDAIIWLYRYVELYLLAFVMCGHYHIYYFLFVYYLYFLWIKKRKMTSSHFLFSMAKLIEELIKITKRIKMMLILSFQELLI